MGGGGGGGVCGWHGLGKLVNGGTRLSAIICITVRIFGRRVLQIFSEVT